jgi:hypothetical protein
MDSPCRPQRKDNTMDKETFRDLSTRLTLAYARCFENLRAAFFPTAPRGERTRAGKPEQRWENEGGKPH